MCVYVCVCVCVLIFFYILFAPSSCSDHFQTKDGHFLGSFRSVVFPSQCVCVCFCLPAVSVTYLNFTRAYTGKDKRDLYPLMPVICSIKLLYAADTLRADLVPFPFPFPFVIAFLSFLLP